MWEVLVLGMANGLRTMTPIAVVCWAAWLGFLPEQGWGAWAGTLPAVIIFTLCAAGEWVADILPQTPSRKTPFPFLARIVFGALSASLVWHAQSQPVAGGIVAGGIGAVLGTLGGYRARMWAAQKLGRDWPAGVLESAFAVAVAAFMLARVHHALISPIEVLLQHAQAVAHIFA